MCINLNRPHSHTNHPYSRQITHVPDWPAVSSKIRQELWPSGLRHYSRVQVAAALVGADRDILSAGTVANGLAIF